VWWIGQWIGFHWIIHALASANTGLEGFTDFDWFPTEEYPIYQE